VVKGNSHLTSAMYAFEDPQEVETFIAFFSTDCINVNVNISNYQDLVRHFFCIASFFGERFQGRPSGLI